MSSKPSEKRQVVRFAFYKLDSAWRRLPAERQASAKLEFGETIESFAGRLLLRPYGLVGIRGDCDFLLWQVAEDLDSLVALQTALNRTDLGAYLTLPYSYLAMTRRSIYEFPEDPGQPSRLVIRPSEARYLFVYPFTKTRLWYLLPKAERQTMMDEHVRVGRRYPSIRLNTTYSYGLDDQEFIVAFEGDNPADFLDLVMELRESKASSYTLRDTPTFTCVQMSLWDMLDTMGGAGAAPPLARRPARAVGYTPVATPAELAPGAGRRVHPPREAHRLHTGVVHAAGGALPAGVPRPAPEAFPARAVPQAGPRGPGNAAAGRAVARGRGDPVRRHPAAVRAAGAGAHVRGGRRTADHAPDPRGGASARPAARGSGHGPGLRPRGRAAGGAGAAGPRPAHRLRRRVVHTRELRDRRGRHAGLHAHQAVHVCGAAIVARADAPARRARGQLPRGAGPRGRPGAAAVRQLGRLPLPRRLRHLRVSPQPARVAARRSGRRPGHPLRHRHGDIPRGLRARRGRRDRRGLAHSARRRLGAAGCGEQARHPGESGSRGAARPASGARATRAGHSRPRRRAARSHLQPWARRAARESGGGGAGRGGLGAWRVIGSPSC